MYINENKKLQISQYISETWNIIFFWKDETFLYMKYFKYIKTSFWIDINLLFYLFVLCFSFHIGRLYSLLWSWRFWSLWNPLWQISHANLFIFFFSYHHIYVLIIDQTDRSIHEYKLMKWSYKELWTDL